jgi:ABC-type uncharacterized transport system involved in gliding motility auxiliary subunit
MKFPGKILACALLFVGLVLVNYLASSLPVRLDLTAESIYSLSPGTRAVLAKIEEPVVLDLYFTKDASGLPIAYKNYAARVQEMLRQYVRAARGKLVLNLIDPRPDTPEEEKATGAGLTPQVAPTGGDRFFFGLVATQADQQKNIPAFTPQREQFLEYDLSQLIYSVQLLDKPRLGLITSLPLQGASAQELQLDRLLHRPVERGQMVADEWEQSFQIEKIEGNAPALPGNLDALAVIHPQNLSPKLQYAIDQFLLAGKPVFLALDPSSQYFKNQGDGQMAMMGGSPSASSDLPQLLKAYDIVYDPRQVVGDLTNAANVRTESGDMRYPVWLSLGTENFNAKWLPTAQIKSAVFIEAGSLSLKNGSSLTFIPMVETSAQSGEMPGAMLQFAQTEEIARQIKPTGKKTIAALVTGKFKTAFPEGAPQEETRPAPGAKAEAPKPVDEAKPADSLKASRSTSILFVIADTDWLFDDYSVRKFNYFGQTAAEPLNDNLTLASNTVEFLGGSQDLISIRGKGSSLRPFTVVQKMEVEAQKKYQEKLTELDARLQAVQGKLSELQGGKTEGNRLVATPEMQKAIEDFQKQSAALRGERREIRRALREDIDALENRLLVINLLAAPLLVGVFGLLFHRARRT